MNDASAAETLDRETEPAAGAAGKDTRLKAFLRSAVDRDIGQMLGRLTRPGDAVLEVTAGPRFYAGQLPGLRLETICIRRQSWSDEMADLRARVKALAKARFDVIFLQGIVSYAKDIQEILDVLRPVCHPDTRLVLLSYNAFWQPVLRAASWLKVRQPTPDENWLSSQDVANLLVLSGYELISLRRRVLFPPGCRW